MCLFFIELYVTHRLFGLSCINLYAQMSFSYTSRSKAFIIKKYVKLKRYFYSQLFNLAKKKTSHRGGQSSQPPTLAFNSPPYSFFFNIPLLVSLIYLCQIYIFSLFLIIIFSLTFPYNIIIHCENKVNIDVFLEFYISLIQHPRFFFIKHKKVHINHSGRNIIMTQIYWLI